MFFDGFPLSLKSDVSAITEYIPMETYYNVNIGASEQMIKYIHNNNLIQFPSRIYYVDISDNTLSALNTRQKEIMHCIYTRSCDGFIREKHLKELLQMEFEDFAIPYIVKLCDEYVIEILDTIYFNLKRMDNKSIKDFCFENIQAFCVSHSRMISYWNEYYRYKHYDINQYVGEKLFKECLGYSRSIEKRGLKSK